MKALQHILYSKFFLINFLWSDCCALTSSLLLCSWSSIHFRLKKNSTLVFENNETLQVRITQNARVTNFAAGLYSKVKSLLITRVWKPYYTSSAMNMQWSLICLCGNVLSWIREPDAAFKWDNWNLSKRFQLADQSDREIAPLDIFSTQWTISSNLEGRENHLTKTDSKTFYQMSL